MKNQYFGDINDYKKYGLLRMLSAGGVITTAVCWMLTDADTRSDGNRIDYLRYPQLWRHFDPVLFDSLARCLAAPAQRSVQWAEETQLIPSAMYFTNLLGDDPNARREYMDDVLFRASHSDLVFFDPDNGLEVRSKPYGRQGSNKYLYFDELARTFSAGHSALVYQHFQRVERVSFLESLSRTLRERLRFAEVISFRTAHVAFLLLPQERLRDHFRTQSARVAERWGNHIIVAHHA